MISEVVYGLDQFFSPRNIADTVADVFVRAAENSSVGTIEVVDFCAGHGSLLDAISTRLSGAMLVGTDIDPSCVRLLRKHRPSWSIGKLDLLSVMSRQRSPLYCESRYAGFVLNPPFSGRGGQVVRVVLSDGNEFTCSRPLAFFLFSAQALRIGGVGVGVLPLSVLRSDRDARVIRWLSDRMELTVHAVIGKGGFSGVAAQSAIVSVTRCNVCDDTIVSDRLDGTSCGYSSAVRCLRPQVLLFRGKLPVYRRFGQFVDDIDGVRSRYVHTTDLRKPVSTWSPITVDKGACMMGECVLIPRVGKISSHSVVIYSEDTPLVLSDCLFALSPLGYDLTLNGLRSILIDRIDDFVSLSQATGAPYLTVSQVRSLIEDAGYDVVVHHCKAKCTYR